MSYEFVPIKTDDKSIEEVTNLLRVTFPHAKKYTKEFVVWQYVNNPLGNMIGYNAFLNGELAAHYALMPIRAKVFGKEENGLLSLNTATHPNHRGKRLFTTLADRSYALASDLGFGFVIGVANAQSTPGFLKKLNFQFVGRLDAKLGWGKFARKVTDAKIDYYRVWDETSIQWRLSNPELRYKVKNNRVSSSTDNFAIQAVLKDFDSEHSLDDNQFSLGFTPLKVWIGIDHTVDWKRSFYFNIPMKIRPSPLNLIFKDLTDKDRKFEFSGVTFSALDFDAY
ncbi:hypothetical protein ATO12_18105 [Aquimarina atlantica]|uniref:Uncharacterized protein n=1 Tax=Aquimarina atlantica TaxID=1317122 RepID=A0A023BSK3_9FLAO|nr:GNAT family N-acetyltransferase [Aquimarina atlantica]EZH72934.1 hypothetical protein ATO12_18105 [Aquimarina atlantica]